MEYIRITRDNIDAEHVCCAMSDKQALAKKEWLKRRFDEGLIFYRSVERGKCFIEYIPAENAWVPIQADGYLYIDCLWVAGSMKGHGYSNDLLRGCVRDAKEQGRKGLCILSAEVRYHLFSCGVSSSASEIYFSFMPPNAVKSGNALCSFMIFLLSECIHLYPKDIFGVWFVCGLK